MRFLNEFIKVFFSDENESKSSTLGSLMYFDCLVSGFINNIPKFPYRVFPDALCVPSQPTTRLTTCFIVVFTIGWHAPTEEIQSKHHKSWIWTQCRLPSCSTFVLHKPLTVHDRVQNYFTPMFVTFINVHSIHV